MHIHKLAFITLLMLLASSTRAEAPAVAPTHVDHPGLRKLGWQQAVNASAFKKISLYEMIDLLHAMDVHHIELSPGQMLSPEKKDLLVNADLPQADIDALLAKLKALKMDMVSYDAGAFGASEAEAKKLFETAKKLKLKTIVCDPPEDKLEMLDKLATENAINVAIFSASTSDQLAKMLAPRSARVGICADPASWKKRGESPVDVVRKLGARVVEISLADADADGKPVATGKGVCEIEAVLAELQKQNFKGICALRPTEADVNSLPDFAASINGFADIVTKLAGTKP